MSYYEDRAPRRALGPKWPTTKSMDSKRSRTVIRHGTNFFVSSENTKNSSGLTSLTEPIEAAIADLVFAHGLQHGSRSTWTKSQGSLAPDWLEWLLGDPEFKNVRIHSFIYNSSWEKERTLNISDSAKSLLGLILDSPVIPQESTAPLVFIGHGIGGLVIKKAFTLAKQRQEYESIARRARAICFLATPHQGFDLADTLSKTFAVASGQRAFIQDHHLDSIITINDEFRLFASELQIYSFYETVKTNYEDEKCIIVNRGSAVLGYPNEKSAFLTANHREIYEFSSLLDPNYQTVRNALASAVAKLRDLRVPTKNFLDNKQQALRAFLGIHDDPEDGFLAVDSQRVRGSCEWLIEKESFRTWRDSNTSHMYWISGKPATGKSVLAGYAVKHLEDLNLDCIFYFFAHGKSSISSFLRSMAWQMASRYPEILQTVLEICEKNDRLCSMGHRTIWRKLFLGGIFKVKLEKRHYWVVDALDASKADTTVELISFLLKIVDMTEIRIFVTSRNRFDALRQDKVSRSKVFTDEIATEDTQFDMELYLRANMDHLPLIKEEERQDMIRKLLEKSAGCFLWARLVLEELQQTCTLTEIQKVLEDIPSTTDALYSRILSTISEKTYRKPLVKAILTWIVCSMRALTTDELHHALQINLQENIVSVEKCISSCGHLVFVDEHSRVQMVHQTAREYLLYQCIDSEFAIDRKLGHKELAMTCLEYLKGIEMNSSAGRKLNDRSAIQERSSFIAYASNSFFEHIGRVSPTDDDLMQSLTKFLTHTNVLSWIEYIAQNSDLHYLIQTGKALKHFLQRRSRHLSPLSNDVALIESWADDLIRLVTKFGNHLSTYPSSICHLIPPFCPAETAPKRQFGSSTRGITVVGLSNLTWDDCLSTIFHRHQRFSALACSSKHFAVGLSQGDIIIYWEATYQESQVLSHQESVKSLKFGDSGDYLVSAGTNFVRVWDTSLWKELWRFNIEASCMSLAFKDGDNMLLGALTNNKLIMWDLTTGILLNSTDWTQGLEGQHTFRHPTAAEFCMDRRLLAVVYRGQDILLWDLEIDAIYDTFAKEALDGKKLVNTTVKTLAFSNAPDADLLAVSYWDGELLLFNIGDGSIRERIFANAQILVSSPDGRTLASGGSSGDIQLFDFETLELLCQINSDTYAIRELAFSGDSRRLLDIRGSQCRIWDPVALARRDADENTSDTTLVGRSDTTSTTTNTTSTTLVPQQIWLSSPDEVILITALANDETGEIFFCGKEDGSVWQYEVKSGRQISRLFGHAEGISVESLYYEKSFLTSTDSSSRVMTYRLTRQKLGYTSGPPIFDHRTGSAVHQILSNEEHSRLLVSTASVDTLFSISLEGCHTLKALSHTSERPRSWTNHSSNPDRLILIVSNVAHVYEWETLDGVTDSQGIVLRGLDRNLGIRTITPCFNDTIFAVAFSESSTSRSKLTLLLFRLADFSSSVQEAIPAAKYLSLSDKAEFLVGAYRSRLVFLDSNGWICSVAADSLSISRHFFLPVEWLSNNVDLKIKVTKKGSIIFVKRDEVAVITMRPPFNEQTVPQLSINDFLDSRKNLQEESQRPGYEVSKDSTGDGSCSGLEELEKRVPPELDPVLQFPKTLREAFIIGSYDAVLRLLTKSFDQVATDKYAWLRELDAAGYTREEISELLWESESDAPWIFFQKRQIDSLAISPNNHILECSHRRSLGSALSSTSLSDFSDRESLIQGVDLKNLAEGGIQELVHELCGLGGIVPNTRDRDSWVGQVFFQDQNSSSVVTYNLPANENSNKASERAALVCRICDALEQFCNAVAWSQCAGLCCNSFTILRKSHVDIEQSMVEMCRVEVRQASELLNQINLLKLALSRKGGLPPQDLIAAAQTAALQIICVIGKIRLPGVAGEEEDDTDLCLQTCALAVQFLCLGFVSYCQAHSGLIRPFFLDTPQMSIILLGGKTPGNDGVSIATRLENLTCVGDMIEDSVVIFELTSVQEERPPSRDGIKLDLLVSAEDFMDTWGPGKFIFDSSNDSSDIIRAISIGGGTIQASDKVEGKFHWASGIGLRKASPIPFAVSTKIIIGAGFEVKVNYQCQIDEEKCWRESEEQLDNLGTYDCTWELTERNVGIQGGNFLNVQAVQTYGKTPDRCLKQCKLELPDDLLLPFLQSPWGLQVSLCTGISRRVLLRELIADLMPAFIESFFPVPGPWQDLRDNCHIIDAFRGPNLQEWLGKRTEESQALIKRVVRSILSILQPTGIDKKGKHLIVAWIQKNRPFQCFKVPCHKDTQATYWAQLLADSEHCATFAYITPKCLVSNALGCRGPQAKWSNVSALLETAVCRHHPSQEQSAVAKQPWALKHSDLYSIGKTDALLLVKVHRPNNNDRPLLHVSWSEIPKQIIYRLRLKITPKGLQRLRERQTEDSPAEAVLILAGEGGI